MPTSRSSFCSSDSDSEEERLQQEAKRVRARKKARREEHDAKKDKKAEKAAAKTKAVALGIMKMIPYTVVDNINTYARGGGGDDDDDDEEEEEDLVMENVLEIISRKPDGAPEEVVDMSDWKKAEEYVRAEFKVHKSIEKVALVMQYFDLSDNVTPKL